MNNISSQFNSFFIDIKNFFINLYNSFYNFLSQYFNDTTIGIFAITIVAAILIFIFLKVINK